MPRLWTETIETHRREVREAILDTTIALVEEQGVLGVTMSQIADATGIGRATLYNYFPDVGAILLAWHEREIARHLGYLAEVRERPGGPGARVARVLHAYALISQESRGHDKQLAELLHRGEHIVRAENHLRRMISDLLAEAAEAGDIRDDVATEELAAYCLHALSAARTLRSKSAIRRLVQVTLAGLRPQR